MIRLMREVRFFGGSCREPAGASGNSWAGTRGAAPVPPFWTIRAVIEGNVDSSTGYLCDIKSIDQLVWDCVAPRLLQGDAARSLDETALALQDGSIAAGDRLGPALRLLSVQVRFSPFTHLTVLRGVRPMLMLTQSYEFSASHRLSCPGLSDQENLRLFGKCSNPHGHGHNYLLEVTVESKPDHTRLTLVELDRVVLGQVIERFDHKNLNLECDEFADLNPTVENIAQVIHDRLAGPLAPHRLANVRVWETAKTYAECFSGDPPVGR